MTRRVGRLSLLHDRTDSIDQFLAQFNRFLTVLDHCADTVLAVATVSHEVEMAELRVPSQNC